MRILVAGGGSGGHLTPALAILEVLAVQQPGLEVIFVCDKKFAPQARSLLADSSLPITLRTIAAGKMRRYHGVAWWKQLLDTPTLLQNIGDLFLIALGVLQSWMLLGKFKPQVVFAKGGFVCLPVGLAARWRGIPLVIHDSDAHPGLTNRILARWASCILTGAPLDNYNYNPRISRYTGMPVAKRFIGRDDATRRQVRQDVMADPTRALVVVVGGGLGAQRLNMAMRRSAKKLVEAGIEVVHVAGAAHGHELGAAIATELGPRQAQFYHVESFVNASRMADILHAADVVVSRAGATAMAELAALGKAAILVPNPMLTGGHQLKNAQVYGRAGAAEVVGEDKLSKDNTILQQLIIALVSEKSRRVQLERAISTFAKPQAAADAAEAILDVANRRAGE